MDNNEQRRPWRPKGYIEQDFNQTQSWGTLGCIFIVLPLVFLFFLIKVLIEFNQ
ncbi:hypothetical protein NJL88_11540 [Streptomyces sp. DK15]|uniref:hypothetical protein n=1 Tax=Streptomyces sp. DK15 TaxID=2957499 RepID=UPI0029BD4A78|nr:hypothetical protein [Streptomyces sp. DK15]MDX2390686.1 hypothetical protein [Streptomyces sp. DK15]